MTASSLRRRTQLPVSQQPFRVNRLASPTHREHVCDRHIRETIRVSLAITFSWSMMMMRSHRRSAFPCSGLYKAAFCRALESFEIVENGVAALRVHANSWLVEQAGSVDHATTRWPS